MNSNLKSNVQKSANKPRSNKRAQGNRSVKLQATNQITPARPKCDLVPVDLRARVRTNQVDFIRNQARTYNQFRIPEWDVWPLETKIPDIRERVWPIDSVYYTRGKVGQTLLFKSNRRLPGMRTDDPKGFLKPCLSYSALHDPHAKSYFKTPEVQKILRRNQLVNEKDEVICSIKDYNQFRKYLSKFQNETTDERLHQEANLRLFHADVQIPFSQYVKNKEHPVIVHATRSQREMKDNRSRALRKELERKMERYESRMARFKQVQREKLMNSVLKMRDRDHRAKMRRVQLLKYEDQTRRDVLNNNIMDMAQAVTNKEDYLKMIHEVKQDVQKERAYSRRVFESHDAELMEVVEESMKRQKKRWLLQYEKRLNAASQTMDSLKAASEKKKKREKFLSRKYYDLWRSYIVRNRVRVYSASHASTFRVENEMKRMVEWLDQETGYDLVMAIVRKAGDAGGMWNIRAHFANSGHSSRRSSWSRRNSRRTTLGELNGGESRQGSFQDPKSARNSKNTHPNFK